MQLLLERCSLPLAAVVQLLQVHQLALQTITLTERQVQSSIVLFRNPTIQVKIDKSEVQSQLSTEVLTQVQSQTKRVSSGVGRCLHLNIGMDDDIRGPRGVGDGGVVVVLCAHSHSQRLNSDGGIVYRPSLSSQESIIPSSKWRKTFKSTRPTYRQLLVNCRLTSIIDRQARWRATVPGGVRLMVRSISHRKSEFPSSKSETGIRPLKIQISYSESRENITDLDLKIQDGCFWNQQRRKLY